MPWAVPPLTTSDVPAPRRRPAAVAEGVAALDARARRGRVAVTDSAPGRPSHRAVPIRGRNVEVGVRRAQLRAARRRVRWLTQTVAGRRARRATTSVISRSHLGQVRARGSAAGAAPRPRAAPARRPRSSRPASRSSGAVIPCRSIEVTCSSTKPGRGVPVEQRGEVLDPADGVHHPGRHGRVHLERGAERAPGREHQQRRRRSAWPACRQLVVGADRERVGPEPLIGQPLRPARQPAEVEAVAVALGDRHQPRGGLGDRAQVGAPAFAVDGAG